MAADSTSSGEDGRQPEEKEKDGTTEPGIKLELVPELPGALPPAAVEASASDFNLPPSGPPAVVNMALLPPPGVDSPCSTRWNRPLHS